MSSNTNFNVRKAKKEDMKDVLRLIKELAAFENMEDQVKINVETLENDAFSEHPVFQCFVAETDNKLIGYAIYYICYSTWLGKSIFLEDLYVQEEYRRQDIGKKLFLSVAKLAYETSGRMDFHVLSWNPAIEFYKRMGSANLTEVEDWTLFRLNGEALKKHFQ